MKQKILALLLALFLLLSMTACGAKQDASPNGTQTQDGETVVAAQALSLAGTYVYNEHVEFGGQSIDSVWTLTLSDNNTYQMDTEIMGQPTTLTGTYTAKDGVAGQITTSAPNEGAPSVVMFFSSDGTCDWQLTSDGTCEPILNSGDMAGGLPGETPGDMGGMPGMPGMGGMGGFSFDADYENVSYASNSASQVMNIYLPGQATDSDPALVVVHGGGFKFGSQTMEIIEPIVKAGMENGYVVASVDYRKSGEATFPGALSDVKAAVRYLRANAAKYGIDPDKIVIWGESAGAYLADMTALTSAVTALDGDVTENVGVSSAVSAMVSFYAPIEFYTMDDEFIALGDSKSANHSQNSFETDYLGIPDMTADKDGVYKSWWGTYKDQVPTGLKAWIQAGTADTNVPYTQSQNLASGLTEVLGTDNVQFGLIEGAAHEDARFYTDENLAQIFAFLADALK